MTIYYHVAGEIEILSMCDCEFCEGHSEFVPVNEIVPADDENDAIAKVFKATEYRYIGESDWSINPSVEEVPEEIFMRLQKHPEFYLGSP